MTFCRPLDSLFTAKRVSSAVAILVLSLILAACGEAESDSPESGSTVPTVLASTNIWGDVVANVACGGLATVDVLTPPGADPHDFEPSLADRGRLEAAALVSPTGSVWKSASRTRYSPSSPPAHLCFTSPSTSTRLRLPTMGTPMITAKPGTHPRRRPLPRRR